MILNRDQYFERLRLAPKDYHANYLSMYSSLVDGIVTDPLLMCVPLDDHLVHCGDGIFEAFKCVGGGVYNLRAHMQRLTLSASAISLALPQTLDRIEHTIFDTIRVSAARDCYVRVFVSRGPGSFGVSPYESPSSQLYVIVTRLPPPFMTQHPDGAIVITSTIPIKPPFFAVIKACNYLPNVLTKKEAIDAGAHFAAAFDPAGFLAEGATENIGIVTVDGALRCPRLDNVLCGTTMSRAFELATGLVANGLLTSVGYGDITQNDIANAREMLIFGTTTDVTRVCRFDRRDMPSACPVFEALSQLLLDDINHGTSHRTPVYPEGK